MKISDLEKMGIPSGGELELEMETGEEGGMGGENMGEGKDLAALQAFTDDDLIEELKRRGLEVEMQ